MAPAGELISTPMHCSSSSHHMIEIWNDIGCVGRSLFACGIKFGNDFVLLREVDVKSVSGLRQQK